MFTRRKFGIDWRRLILDLKQFRNKKRHINDVLFKFNGRLRIYKNHVTCAQLDVSIMPIAIIAIQEKMLAKEVGRLVAILR